MAGRALLLRAEPGFSLPAFERFAPPPAPAVIAARIEAHSGPGDIVLDLHGRGGWVARSAIDRQRKAVSVESTPLDRLLAEIVLRPPDLRHLDAAVQALAASARQESSLKASIADRYGSRCATCDRPVVLDEVTWAVAGEGADEPGPRAPLDSPAVGGARPIRKHYRCSACRGQLGGPEVRTAPLDERDVARALDADAAGVRSGLRERFPVLEGGVAMPDDLLDLHSPLQLVALAAILQRIEGDLRAAPVAAALRLALLHALGPASRLATSANRVAPLRIVSGRVRVPGGAQWRERNPWLAFEDGIRVIRGFIQRLESGAWGPVQARLGEDLRSLAEGSAQVVLKVGTPAAYGALGLEGELLSGTAIRPRVRLVLGAPPLRPDVDRLAWAYHGTSWVLGREAAATLPLEPLFGPAVRATWGWQAAALSRSLRAVEPVLARDGRVVLLVDGGVAESVAASVLGGVGAGFRVAGARLGEPDGMPGLVELVPPGSGAVPRGPRTRANRPLPPVPGGAGDPDIAPASSLFAAPERSVNAPFSRPDAARAVVDAAVDVLKLRGEPISFDGLIGEVLVGLDRGGHLRRLTRSAVAPPSSPIARSTPGEAPPEAALEAATEGAAPGEAAISAHAEPAPPADIDAGPSPDSGPGAAGDPVERLIALVRDALAGARDRRLAMVEGDRWWLADREDREAAAVPLADRVEWAVYSLLSTAGPLSEPAFLERIAGLFTGPDLPDEGLVRACLDSYRSLASTPDRLVTGDDLLRRSQEHGELLGTLLDLGHRLGFSVWIGRRQQARRAGGAALGDRLDTREASAPPYLGHIRSEHLEDVDVIWYVRGRMAFLWEVEWTAMLGETILRRHAAIPADDRLVRFVVVLPERAELVRYKIERSPLLREVLERGDWHILKSNHLLAWAAREAPALADLEPLLGLDPGVERTGDQLSLFS
jgi:hypothetical protein